MKLAIFCLALAVASANNEPKGSSPGYPNPSWSKGWCSNWKQLPNTNQPGHKAEHGPTFFHNPTSPEDCAAKCKAHPDCTQAVYEEGGHWGQECWLGGQTSEKTDRDSRGCNGRSVPCVDHCYHPALDKPVPSAPERFSAKSCNTIQLTGAGSAVVNQKYKRVKGSVIKGQANFCSVDGNGLGCIHVGWCNGNPDCWIVTRGSHVMYYSPGEHSDAMPGFTVARDNFATLPLPEVKCIDYDRTVGSQGAPFIAANCMEITLAGAAAPAYGMDDLMGSYTPGVNKVYARVNDNAASSMPAFCAPGKNSKGFRDCINIGWCPGQTEHCWQVGTEGHTRYYSPDERGAVFSDFEATRLSPHCNDQDASCASEPRPTATCTKYHHRKLEGECSHTTCEIKQIKIASNYASQIAYEWDLSGPSQTVKHNVMIVHHSNEENMCHKHSFTRNADGSWSERYPGADANGHQFHGSHCGLTDVNDVKSCKCFAAGSHPRGTLPYAPQGVAHDITLPTVLPKHPQHASNIVQKAKQASRRHDDTPNKHNPRCPGDSYLDGKTCKVHTNCDALGKVTTTQGSLTANAVCGECKFGYFVDGDKCTEAETDEEYARTLDGHKIHLRSANGKFLVAEDHGAANANRKKAGSWETFTLSYEGGKKVGFKGAHDKYLVAEANGDANANRPVLAGWEKFEVDKVGPHSITLKGAHGKYLVAEDSGALNANSATPQTFKVFAKGTACDAGSFRNADGKCKQYGGRCKWGELRAQSDRAMENHCGECKFGFYLDGGACHVAETSVDYARAMDDTKIHLRAANGKYVTAMSDGKADANGKNPSSWETLTLEWLGGTRVGFKSIHGKYFVAEAGGSVNANRPSISSWETFEMEHFGNHKVTLKGDHGKYLVVNEEGHFEQETTAQEFKIYEKGQACPAGQMRLGDGSCQQRAGTCKNGELAAEHDRVREDWCGSCDFLYYLDAGRCRGANTNEQVARSLNNERINLLSAHGNFVVAEDTGAANADRSKASSWERFTFLWQGGDKVAFKSVHGKYLVAEPNGEAHFNRPVLSSWETFQIQHYGNGRISLLGEHGMWLVAEKSGELNANRESVGGFEKFKVVVLN